MKNLHAKRLVYRKCYFSFLLYVSVIFYVYNKIFLYMSLFYYKNGKCEQILCTCICFFKHNIPDSSLALLKAAYRLLPNKQEKIVLTNRHTLHLKNPYGRFKFIINANFVKY